MSRQRLQDLTGHQLTKDLVQRGLLIEAGFALFCMHRKIDVQEVPAPILQEYQLAFYAGAEHVWSSIMNVLDEGQEPTDADMQRMDKVQNEIDNLRPRLMFAGALPEGSA
jgi:hypothetical protein